MLYQFHHQFKDGHTEMISQEEFIDNMTSDSFNDMKNWVKEVNELFPLPKDAICLMVNEKSELFVWAVNG